MSTSPRTKARPMTDPHDEPIYRAILAVLVGSVLAGAVLALTGEPLFDSRPLANVGVGMAVLRSEEHTSELQSLMRISYAVFCLKKKNKTHNTNTLRTTKVN